MRSAALLIALGLSACSTLQLGEPLGAVDTEAPLLPLERAWEQDVQAGFGAGAAYVTNRYVVVGTRQGEVVVLDLENGSVEGVGEFGASLEGPLAVSPGGETIYLARAEERGGVVAYDVAEGLERWAWEGGPVDAGVLVQGDVVVVPTLAGALVGLGAATGEERWRVPMRSGAQFHAPPVPVSATDILVGDDRGRVHRVRSASGEVVWNATVGAPIYHAPAADDQTVYVPTTRGTLTALDLATGALRWTHETGQVDRVSTPAIGAGVVAVGTTGDGVRALDAGTGDLRWTHRTDGSVSGAPLWLGGSLVVGTLDQRVLVLDGATGAQQWSDAVRGRVKSAVGAGGGLVIVLTEPRHVVAYRSARPAS